MDDLTVDLPGHSERAQEGRHIPDQALSLEFFTYLCPWPYSILKQILSADHVLPVHLLKAFWFSLTILKPASQSIAVKKSIFKGLPLSAQYSLILPHRYVFKILLQNSAASLSGRPEPGFA